MVALQKAGCDRFLGQSAPSYQLKRYCANNSMKVLFSCCFKRKGNGMRKSAGSSTMEIGGLTRRGFLTGAAVTAVAAMGAGMLTGCGQGKPSDESEGAGAGAAPSSTEAEDIEPVAVPAAWDEEFDVVVVGSGGGLFGAVRAAELGASVCCVEKSASVGGASKESSIFAVSGTKVQTAAGLPDISALMIQAALANQTAGAGNEKSIINIGMTATRAMDWVSDLGLELEPTTTGGPQGGVTGVSPAGKELDGLAARTNIYAYTFLEEQLAAMGGTLKLNTKMTGLVKDGDAIVGIQVDDENGETKHLRASKGVILAAGGMCSNRDMLAKYVPSAYNRVKCSSAGTQDSGESIRMGLGAGAQLGGYDSYQAFDGGLNDVPWDYYLYNGDIQLARQAWLGIDARGNRVPYYTSVANYSDQAVLYQNLPGSQKYCIFDSHYAEYAPTFMQECCRRLIVPTMPDIDRVPEALIEHDWQLGAQRGIDEGRIKVADTLEELAELLGLDAGIVTAAVERWNADVAATPESLDGIPGEWLHPVVDGPFYGVAVGSIMFSTQTGLLVNENMQVVSAKGTVIPGLYASGSNAGGQCGPDASYGKCLQPQGGVCYAATTAFMAGEHVMGALPEFQMPEFLLQAAQ